MSEIQKPLFDKSPEGSCTPEAVGAALTKLGASKDNLASAQQACQEYRGTSQLAQPGVNARNQRAESNPDFLRNEVLKVGQNQAEKDAAARARLEASIATALRPAPAAAPVATAAAPTAPKQNERTLFDALTQARQYAAKPQ